MGSLRALLCSAPAPTVSVKQELESPPILTKNRIMKRAAFEEWHTKKFLTPPLSRPRPPAVQDDENQPIDLIKRFRDEEGWEKSFGAQFSAEMFLDAETVQRNFALCLRMFSPECATRSAADSARVHSLTSESATLSNTLACSVQSHEGSLSKSCQEGGVVTGGCARADTLTVSSQAAKKLTAPKLSRHNDAAYYPNIQCILCKEWVCSRNRYMHIESHLQYRPYKCSVCGYDNRKEIFINLHIKKTHGGAAAVEYKPDPDLEHRAWVMAEQCLQHTRDVLQRAHEQSDSFQEESPSTSTVAFTSTEPVRDKVDEELLSKYGSQYRPRLYNSQRAEKSLVIEGSLKMGIVPDFTEVSNREIQCQVCESFVIAHATVMEEHARSHLSHPSYRCSIDDCSLEHNSKNFLTRHMKEVHKYRRSPFDMTESDSKLKREFLELSVRCFPGHFATDRGVNGRRAAVLRSTCSKIPQESPSADFVCAGKQQPSGATPSTSADAAASCDDPPHLSTLSSLLTVTSKQLNVSDCAVRKSGISRKACNFCQEMFDDNYSALYRHAKQHLSVPPYECSACRLSSVNRQQLLDHIAGAHSYRATLVDRMNDALARQCCALFSACFPGVPLQPALHDRVESESK